jgi:D-ribose pyranase
MAMLILILNPQINSCWPAWWHTNTLDRRSWFPFWPMIETVDISLVDGDPNSLQVLQAVRPF